jgi:hypothetical protein
VIAVARPPSAQMLDADPALRRYVTWGQLLKYPVIACLALVAAAIVLSIAVDPAWLLLLFGAAFAWLGFARLAVHIYRELHLSDLRWRLDHGSQRERNLLALAQRATWPWSEEVPDEATHAVLVVGEIGGSVRVAEFCDWEKAKTRLDHRLDLLGGERDDVTVGFVELDAPPESALIEIDEGRPGKRRAIDSLELDEDGWLVGI